MKHFVFLITILLSTTLCYSQLETRSFEFEGLTREYEVFLPQNYQPNMPLVFVFHGYTEGLGFIREYSKMNEVADTAGFVAVYPQSIWPSWNCGVFAPPPMTQIDTTVNDIGFISALIDTIYANYEIDLNRIYSCGFSMGGEMTYRLNAEIGHRFAAFASVAGLLNDVSAAAYFPRTPKPILHFHGTLDNYEYYDGGWSNLWSVDETLDFWLEKNDCQLTPDTLQIPNTDPDDGCTAEMISYTNCWGTSKIIFYKITGGGHSWPGTPYNYGWAGNVNRDIHASSLIWDFFKDYELVSLVVENPFGLPVTDYAQGLRFADFDDDEDLDLLVAELFGGEGGFHYYENIGSKTELEFAPPLYNPFGLVAINSFPAITDLDGDGDLDIMVGKAGGSLNYFENIGSVTEPQYSSPLLNPFGLESTNVDALPTFIDLDADGDFDLMVGENLGVMQYFENTGSSTDPEFAAPQEDPFGIESTTSIASNASSFADLDFDGDMDMLFGRNLGTEYFENIGTPSDPQFAPPLLDPFGIDPTITWVWPDYADLDNDGDMDLLIAFSSYSGYTQYYENFSPLSIADTYQSLAIGLYPNPVLDILYFEAEEQIDRIELFSITGQLIHVFENPMGHILINNLNPGLYVLRIISVKGDYAVRKLQKL